MEIRQILLCEEINMKTNSLNKFSKDFFSNVGITICDYEILFDFYSHTIHLSEYDNNDNHIKNGGLMLAIAGYIEETGEWDYFENETYIINNNILDIIKLLNFYLIIDSKELEKDRDELLARLNKLYESKKIDYPHYYLLKSKMFEKAFSKLNYRDHRDILEKLESCDGDVNKYLDRSMIIDKDTHRLIWIKTD